MPKRRERVPLGYTLLERTPLKYEANLNASASAISVFLCYRQRLSVVEHHMLDIAAMPVLPSTPHMSRNSSSETVGSGKRV